MGYLCGIKHVFVGIICLITGLTKADNNDQIRFQCPTGWTNINYMCYKAVNKPVPWDIASDVCRSMQSELVTIPDYWFNKDVGDEALKNGLSEYWIGFNQLRAPKSSKKAYWGNGEETNIKNGYWADYNPDMTNGKCSYEIQSDKGPKWVLGNCDYKKPFVCEKTACTVDTFMCDNSRCIGQKQICDGKDDCKDGSDEKNCPHLGRFYQTGSTGTLKSGNYPLNYPKNSFCLWKIQSDMGTSIELTFSDFLTEVNTDVVEIFVGSLSESEAFFKYRLSGDKVTQKTYTSPNNLMVVKFISDFSVEYKGFRAKWTTVTSSLKPINELIAYPSSRNLTVYDYMNNEHNTWTIRTNKRRQIITLEKMQMYLLDKDEVVVFNGDSLDSPILATYNSTDTQLMAPQFVQSTGEALMILLKSRGLFSKGRFIFSYKQGCVIEMKDQLSGEIMSPGYDLGQNYPNSLDCKWYIEIPSNHSYSVKFDPNYDIETPNDVLDIYNIVNSKSTQLYNSTNAALAPKDLNIITGAVQIIFKTNAVVNKKGFKAVFSIDCPDPNFNANTITTPADKNWHYGSTFNVSCQSGYSFYSEEFAASGSTNVSFVSKTSVKMICLKGGQWNVKTIPQCSKNYCGPVKPIRNGRVLNATGVLAGDVAQYTCADGYTIAGKDSVQCEMSGQWEVVPVCNATGCSSPLNITNGQVNITEGTGTSVGSIVFYTCNAGYQIDGVPLSQCEKSAKWSSKPPSCKILQCSAFGLEEKIPNSSIQPSGDVNVTQSKNVTCHSGYTLNGTTTIVCLDDQSFNALPTCEDTDECQPSSNLNRCNQICVNTPGSYYCDCKEGYRMKPDNVTCEDENECQINNGDCEHTCNNTAGSYGCSCKVGYALYIENYTMNYPLLDRGRSSGDVFYLNHSCVRVLCPELGSLANGYIQPQREFSHFGDTFYFSCKIGFILKGAAHAVCLENGNWSATLPTCEAIKCVPDGNNMHPDIPYLGFYNFTCEVKGKPKEYRQRQCLYNPLTEDTYKLLGDSYVCKEIDCGQPKTIPGALELNVTNTTYGSQYEIKCSHLYRLKGNSSLGNTIECGSDGKWDYGDLKCDGVLCDYPPGLAVGTVEVTGFTEGSIATYNCTKEGYVPFNLTQRKCVQNYNKTGLIWDQHLPTCVDVQPPTVKNGTCNDFITLDKYSSLNVSSPEFVDNSESFTVKIEPKEAITGFVVTKNMTIIYTATDAAGYNVSCSRNIFVEDRPLQITCPVNMLAELENPTDTKKIVFNESMVRVTGPGTHHRITFTPTELNIGEANIDNIEPIIVEAFNGQKKVNCTFYVSVQAKSCSALSRPHVQHATWSYAGNMNEFTCNKGYSYPDNRLQIMKTQCISSWDIPYTSCSKLEHYATFYGNMTFIYKYDAVNISDSCATEMQTSLLQIIPTRTKDLCMALNHHPKLKTVDSTFKYTVKGSEVTFRGLLINEADQPLKTYIENTCLLELKSQLRNSAFTLYKFFETLTSKCGNVSFVSLQTDVLVLCSSNTSTLVTTNDFTYCVNCPPGSYYDLSTGVVNCTLCPIGEYQDTDNEPSCKKCPEGTSTYFPGGYNITMCKAKCPAGLFSATGVRPCQSCPVNTYSKSATFCEDCPRNTKGRVLAATSKDSCKSMCKPGSYSFDGYEPCHLCTQGFYSNQEMQTECMECDDKTTTSKAGASSKNSCIDVAEFFCKTNPCKNGQCLPLGHIFTCNCSSGYTGDLCDKVVDRCSPNPCYYGGKCFNDGMGYKCNCTAGTNGKNCELVAENCKNETCENNGICRNKINGIQCYCLSGYDGEFCQNVSFPCNKNPCKNGSCHNLGTDNFKCDCSTGFKGEKCDIQIDNCASSPCLFNSTCTNLVNNFSCNCISGYSGKTCSHRADLCSNAGCNMGTCVPNISRNSYTCSCDVGYTYSDFCQFSIKTSNGTMDGFYEKSENISSKTCIYKCSKSVQCKVAAYHETNKTCYFYKTETDACCKVFTKECRKPIDNFWTPWYTIKDSVKPLVVQKMLKDIGIDVCDGMLTSLTQCKSEEHIDDKMRPDKYAVSLSLTTPCVVDNLDCKNGNEIECSKYRIRFQCAVSKVMQNNQCEKKSLCYDVHCQNGGICLPLTGSCTCWRMYDQPFCRTKKDFCSGKSCGNGTCDKSVCKCHDGFEGPACTNNIDECKANPCNASGTEVSGCQDLVNDYYCPCKAGYKGKNCSENINECLSNPCFHQGVCNDKVNDFTCKCPDGWTGKRCENLVDYCKTNRCTNNGVCCNLFKTYYCSCEPNTHGLNCSESVSMCNDANPCLNAANCSEFGGKAQCTCKQGFTGVGCQIAVDFCKSQMCANGGTCIDEKDSYKCQCPSGFKGSNCEQNTNDCTTSMNTCEVPMPTKCPLGKTGNSCSKDISKDYDLDFYLFEKNGIATLKSAVTVSGTNFSISLWVRFKEMYGQGTFLNLFMIKSNGIIEEKVPVLRISDAGITYTTSNGNEVTAKNKTLKMNDGKWNLFTITISNSGNSKDFRLNNFADFESVSFPVMNFFGKKCVVILGCYYDAKLNMPVVNKGFYGELSQVNLYSKYLDFKTDIIPLIANPQVDLTNILAGWGNYQLGRGVRRIVPSTVNRNSPTVGQTFIDVKSCPKMINNYGSQGRTLLQWNPPRFTDSSELKQNYRPGTTVLWGRYAVTYGAKDKKDNVALCNFMVYAKEGNCTKPDNPYEGTAQCDAQEFPYYSCNITCNKDRALTAPAPLLFTCGPAGSWHPEKTHLPMRFPSCGNIKKTVVSVSLNLGYSIQSTSCSVVKNAMRPKLTETMKELNAQNGFVLCKIQDCSDIQWNFTCHDRVNAAQDLKVNAIINSQNSSVHDILTAEALDKRVFDYPKLVGGGTSLDNQFSLNTTQTCGKGEALIQSQCVECTPGTYLDVSTQCDPCPVGTYQSNVAQTSCTPCPANKTTLGTGHMNVTACKFNCPPGEFFDTATNQCKKCDIVSYQDLGGQFFCKPCLSGRSTKMEGATAEKNCTETCPAGYEFTTTCTACPIGFYRENGTANTCNKCSNKTITLRTGATSESECNISACFAGSYLNEANNTCILCPDGQYQDQINQNSCKLCPSERYRTGEGAQKSADCKFFCESGFEARNKKCWSCPKGTYKDNNEDFYGLCKPCLNNKTTLTVNSTSISDCNISYCTAGFYLDPNNTCLECPLNEYQNVSYQTKCLPCASGFKTWKNASAACVRICPAGEVSKNSVCTPCPVGYFRKTDTETCTKCPNEFLTKEVGAKNESYCIVPPCNAGQYYNGSSCQKCPKDSFQDKKYQKSCKMCPDGKYTTTGGTTKESDCLSYCVTKTHNCSENATCKDDPAGFKCECNQNYVKQGSKCIHLCDTNYCQNGATCSRAVTAICVCSKYYDGPKCERQLSAKEVSQDSTHSIIGAVVGVLAGILIIILIVTYVCVRMRKSQKASKENGPFCGTLSTKYAPTYVTINSLASQPILDQGTQVNAYTNAAYDEDSDPAIFKS